MPKPSTAGSQPAPTPDSKTGEVNFRTRQALLKRERMHARLMAATMAVCSDTKRRGAAVIDDVVRAAGVSRGAFYWYFNSLDEAIEALGRQLADDIIAETRMLFGSQDLPVLLRSALGGQVILCRAVMDRAWAGYLSNVHVLLDGSAFVTGVRRNLEIGKQEGVFHYDSLQIAADFQIGAILGAVRRCTIDPTPPLSELIEANRLILTGLRVDPVAAAATALEAQRIVNEQGPQHLPWWRPLQ